MGPGRGCRMAPELIRCKIMASMHSALLQSTYGLQHSARCSWQRTSRSHLTACASGHPQQQADVPSTKAEQSRRDVLIASGAGIAAGWALLPPAAIAEEQSKAEEKPQIPISSLSTFQKRDQRAAAQLRAETALREGLAKEDASVALRLVLHDAGTYDVATNTGGVNGSIVLDEELNRPENKDLKSYVNKLKPIKDKIDKASKSQGQGEYSWADVIVLAAKVTAVKSWNAIKVKQSGLSGGETISSVYGADFQVRLGRIDSKKADPGGRIPKADAPVSQIQEFLTNLNNQNKGKSGGFSFFQGKPPFWEQPAFVLWTAAQKDPEKEEARWVQDPKYQGYKKDYDRSRKSVTRTNYEVDFITFFTQLANTGAKFNPDAYLKPIDSVITRL